MMRYLIVCLLGVTLAGSAGAAHRISAAELVKFVSAKDWGQDWNNVQVFCRLNGLRWQHKSYRPQQADVPQLLVAMRDPSIDMPARLCVARFLLDLNLDEARRFVHDRLFGDDRSAMNNAAYALLDYADEDPKKTWAMDQMVQAIQDDRLIFQGSTTPGSDEGSEAFEDFCRCLGRARYEKADAALLNALERHPDSDGAAAALADLGDKRAVPIIIRGYESSANKQNLVLDLGKLNTPEAVDFLVAHLDQMYAAEALANTHSPKALPALRAFLERQETRENNSRASWWPSATRVAIARLDSDHPAEALMRIVDNPAEDGEARSDALLALQHYDTSAIEGRILGVYRTETDVTLQRFCIWLLRDGKADGITEALMDRALKSGPIRDKDEGATQLAVLEALNKRLGTDFDTMEELQASLKKRHDNSRAR